MISTRQGTVNSKKVLSFLVAIICLFGLDLFFVVATSTTYQARSVGLTWQTLLVVCMCTEGLALLWLIQVAERQRQICRKLEYDLERCREKNQTKSSFIANTSHEIRAPVGAILGFTKLLQDPSLSTSDREHYGAIIRKTGDSLLHILNDILDLTKVEAGHVAVEKSNFSLRQLLEEVRSICVAKYALHSILPEIEISDNVGDLVYSDPQRLRQILVNVLGNALKFTERGQVLLQVRQNENDLLFKVRDTGLGIHPEDQKILFKAFGQVENSITNSVEGSGLGLLLSRNLARLLGGELSLEYSEHGKGSCFMVRIPLEQNCSQNSLKARPQPPCEVPLRVRGKKILLVDDSEINRLLLERILQQGGLQVQTAKNGEEGVAHALSNEFDFLLMDVQMPIMDGHEATRRLRQAGYSRPIIALTANAMKEDRARCMDSGYNDYLSKPVEFDELFRTLARALDTVPVERPCLDFPELQI